MNYIGTSGWSYQLLAAVEKAGPTLINLEDRSEEEVREIHDRFQELEVRGSRFSSIDRYSPELMGSNSDRGPIFRRGRS